VKPNRGAAQATIDYIRNNYVSTGGRSSLRRTNTALKADHQLNSNAANASDSFTTTATSTRAIGPGGPQGLPLPLYDGQVQTFETEAYRVTHDWTITPRMLNHFGIGGNLFYKVSASATWIRAGKTSCA